MSEHHIAVRQEAALDRPTDLLQIILQVVQDPRMDVEKMERLLAMQERVMADQRKTAFMAAMARLQERLPQIDKHGQAKNSKFAKLEDIDVIIRPMLAEEGFSFSFDEESHEEKTVTFVATLSHRDGHAESKRLTVPIDAAAKNREGMSIRPAIQDAGSTVSYARRYLIKMMLNIIEKNEDTDGEDRKTISAEQVLDIETALQDTKSDKAKFLRLIAGVERLEDIPVRDMKRIMNALEETRRARSAK